MAEGSQFKIRLRNTRKSLCAVGIHVDHSDGETLRIDWIRPDGLFQAWNAAHPGDQVCVGDRIISINGQSGGAVALTSALGKLEQLDVTLRRGPAERPQPPASRPAVASAPPEPRQLQEAGRRCLEFTVRLRGSRGALAGLGLRLEEAGQALRVAAVDGGPAEAWNAANPETQVLAGDRIVAANGRGGSCAVLAAEIERQESLTLTLRRDWPPAADKGGQEPGRRIPGRGPASGPARPEGPAARPVGMEEEAAEEGDEDGGPRWFRIVYRPHVPGRFIVCRPCAPCGRLVLGHSEALEAQEVRGGWARLALSELQRRCLPEGIDVWVLLDGTAMGFARFLEFMPAPDGRLVHEGGGIVTAHNEGLWTDGWGPWDAGRIVLENDKAWRLLQARRRGA